MQCFPTIVSWKIPFYPPPTSFFIKQLPIPSLPAACKHAYNVAFRREHPKSYGRPVALECIQWFRYTFPLLFSEPILNKRDLLAQCNLLYIIFIYIYMYVYTHT